MERHNAESIAYLSTFPPRECGIATFTKDLVEAIQRKYNPALKAKVLAINNDITDMYSYEKQVLHHITAGNIEDYIALARELNQREDIKLIHVQHEFGLFGGDYGNYLIPFFQIIEKPVVVTFHTVLPNPNPSLLRVVRLILQHSKAVIVMNTFSKQILLDEYGAKEQDVVVIPHGIPYVASPNGETEKQRMGFQDHLVLSTFGLLSPGKGIEYALQALPRVVKKFPNVLYLIIGVTHPIVRKEAGETYRNFLLGQVQKLNLQNNVRFYNKYLTTEEIVSFLRSTDIYLSPSLDRNQSVSGTLSYALGCGTPVVCTDSLYARSLVTPNTGILLEPKDSKAITKSLLDLLSDEKRVKEMGKTAFAETRHMTWPNVALGHFKLYQKLAPIHDEQKLPVFTLQHLKKLTDDFGVIQFAKHTDPDLRYGYALDDNARALIVAAMAFKRNEPEALELLNRYLRFTRFALRPNGSFANLINAKHRIVHHQPSEDAQGRALWALGYLVSEGSLPLQIRKEADRLFRKAMPASEGIASLRASAFAMIGLYFYLKTKKNARATKLFEKLASQQISQYGQYAKEDWLWFEDSLTYSNSKLSESLLYAYLVTKKKSYLAAAIKSLNFLIDITFEKGYFSPIGQNGWYSSSGKRAHFDQQPEDTSSMVQTLLVAYQTTGEERYRKLALDTFQWFLGKNHLNQMVYDESTGGCYDGLGQQTLNLNQGAESTISYLLARLALEEL
ncbi:MAG TPA: glycosyltransferase [Candidatus Paceibacterota bacterium]